MWFGAGRDCRGLHGGFLVCFNGDSFTYAFCYSGSFFGSYIHTALSWILHVFPYKTAVSVSKSYSRQTHINPSSLQAVTARPGARFGPGGIRQGSRRMAAPFEWNVYTGMYAAYVGVLRVGGPHG